MSQPQGPGGAAPASKGASIVTYKAELRKAIRRNAHEHEVNFLNITAMLDIMTIILVFLLKTLGESSAAVPQSDDLRLPASIMKKAPAQEGVLVIIAQRFRSQERNREDALERLLDLIRTAAVAPVKRRKTKPTKASKQRRLESKGHHSRIKTLRRAKPRVE